QVSIHSSLAFLPPSPRPPKSTLFPYTTLFRSLLKISEWLKVAVESKEHIDPKTGSDLSYIWRPAIEEHEQNRDYEITGLLVGFRSEEHTSELQSRENLVCRLLLEKKTKRRTSG